MLGMKNVGYLYLWCGSSTHNHPVREYTGIESVYIKQAVRGDFRKKKGIIRRFLTYM